MAIRKLGGEVIGVSKDSQKTADEFCQSLELPYSLVGDEQGRIIKAFKVGWPLLGPARRVTCVIGRDGKIKLAYRNERDPVAHIARAKEALAAL